MNKSTPEQLADKWIKELKEFKFTYEQMQGVFAKAREIFEKTTKKTDFDIWLEQEGWEHLKGIIYVNRTKKDIKVHKELSKTFNKLHNVGEY
ncbi:hypothetical protein [Wenyingzhuangia aestuarii]|uniref:hypothetical protein n=1 Tax=Wenyingzhuangia aestuarii TaxID=1647582 RepID=UPI00143A6622|nr:hypothetical protein [Wenyingzhuangia aestuarii]NJB83639.1 hypothetical protein [Wenyingzhuangia aestuarii]